MTETVFKEALAAFATKSADDLSMTDELEAIGIDSIGIFELLITLEFEYMIRIENVVGEHSTGIEDDVVTVQDLYDHFLRAAPQYA